MIVGAILIILSCFFSCGYNFIMKGSSKISTVIIGNFICGLIFSVLMVFLWKDLREILDYYWFILLMGLACATSFLLLTIAYKKGGNVSFINPTMQAFIVIFSAILSVIAHFFIENIKGITPLGYFGYSVIIFGIIVLPIVTIAAIKFKDYINNITILVVFVAIGEVLATFIMGILMIKLGDNYKPFHSTVLMIIPMRFVVGCSLMLFVFIYNLINKSNSIKEKIDFKGGILMGCFLTLSCTLFCVGSGMVNSPRLSIVFDQVSIPISVLGGWLLFKEKIYMGKIIGACAIIAGIIIISFS